MSVTCPGPAGQPPVTVTIAAGVSYAYSVLSQAVQALVTLYEESHVGQPEPSIITYTPAGLTVPSAAHPAAADPGAIYIENFSPAEGGTYTLALKAEGIILSGSNDAEVYGRSGANELIIGNDGFDKLRGHGGSGTIIAGSGENHIHSGHGNMMIVTGTGNDTIHTGLGNDTVDTYGNAVVHIGAGNVEFHDFGQNAFVGAGAGSSTLFAGSGYDHFVGGSGLTIMHSGTGLDTFTGGSGLTLMNDEGAGGSTVFDFNSTYHGDAIVTGFNAAHDSISLEGYTVAQLLGDTTVSGGNSYVNLGDGTKIVFAGVDITKLSPTSFH